MLGLKPGILLPWLKIGSTIPLQTSDWCSIPMQRPTQTVIAFSLLEASNADIRPSLEVKYTFDPNEIDGDGDGFTEQQGDCNDNDVSIAPGAAEICGDGIDQDCDGMDRACTVESHTMVFGNFSDADVPFTAKDTFININQDAGYVLISGTGST